MSSEDSGLLEHTLKWMSANFPSLYAGLSALCISALIDVRAGKSRLFTATGAMICGIFALTISASLEYFGLPASSGAFVGALVGFVGADRLRNIAVAVIARRAGIDNSGK
ncbi:phage holin, lambda family [Erwiniaceae bacterium BAC15a-03b]|uniref:Phage holin, lambda family n=1 Tax=Winslowiella arboricola TaxID=2978220 RepID=A0A9J6PXB5_9GAMM|nr:phage holin, lambda family [Winslowiella arboricola]MCU5774720.1 phage holin, lambda family [Winslowiella arboricola]MCU5780128.1 phage holin, lambda family [Winslowiella arboricola]